MLDVKKLKELLDNKEEVKDKSRKYKKQWNRYIEEEKEDEYEGLLSGVKICLKD